MSATVRSRTRQVRRTLELGGRRVEYTVRFSAQAKRVRVRVGPAGVEVVVPAGQPERRATEFLREHETWVRAQLERVERLKVIRPPRSGAKTILLRGREVAVVLETDPARPGTNLVEAAGDRLVVRRGSYSRTPLVRTLENWLRRQARQDIQACLERVLARVGRRPGRVYVMGQRTKWGNCSALGNLSFNWRLVMAPPLVLEYIVVHEAVHLAVPDHSAKFWLLVRSLCRETERARGWLREHEQLVMQSLEEGV